MCPNRVMFRCLKQSRDCFHRYGIKHFLLFLTFVGYLFVGGIVFFIIEYEPEKVAEQAWRDEIEGNRTSFIDNVLFPDLFNNSHYLIYVNHEKSTRIARTLQTKLNEYERLLQVQFRPTTYRWNLLTAIHYSTSIVTTIGYSHVKPYTEAGKIATLIYVFFGLPLTILVIHDLGRLLIVILNYPTRLMRACWSCVRFWAHGATDDDCTSLLGVKQRTTSLHSVHAVSVTLATVLLVGWLLLGTFLFMLWEEWTFVTSLHFVFSSLATLGGATADALPANPHFLLAMFAYTIIGLTLVSTYIHILYAKIIKAYELPRHTNYSYTPARALNPQSPPMENGARSNTNTPSLPYCGSQTNNTEQIAPSDVTESCDTLGLWHINNRWHRHVDNALPNKSSTLPSQKIRPSKLLLPQTVSHHEDRLPRNINVSGPIHTRSVQTYISMQRNRAVQVDYDASSAGSNYRIRITPTSSKSLDDVGRLVATERYNDLGLFARTPGSVQIL